MKRYAALQQVAALVTADDLVVISIGTITNEWYSVMPSDGTIFLSLMGGVVPFAFGLTVSLPHRRVVAIDTDGSFLSNPGALCTVVNEAAANLTVLVIDNEMYVDVGVTGNIEWFETAKTLLDRTLEQFVADGSYYDTAADAEELVWRPQDPTDNASPSGVSLAAEAFTMLASLTGSVRYESAAEQALEASAAIAARAPRFAGRALAVAETIASGPLEIAIAGASSELLRTALSTATRRLVAS